MNDHLVKPVLKRKDSMKQIRQIVLENSITTFAAERLESALNAGDKFVDTYLQPLENESDQTDGKIKLLQSTLMEFISSFPPF